MKDRTIPVFQRLYSKIELALKKVAILLAMVAVLITNGMIVWAGPQGEITATAWALVDVATGQVLASQLGDHRMNPASITKILTVAMALEKCQNDTSIQLTVSHDAVHSITFDSSHIALQEGEVVSVADMLYGAMLASGNDAANVLAEYVCGSLGNVEPVFTQKLAELGCENTHFVNAHGLYNENHYTTAEDMAKILRWALTVPGFQEVFNSEKYEMQPTNLQPEIRYFSTADWMRLDGIKYHYDYALGSKNGWTTESGHTFASWAEKDGRQLICILMNSATKYKKFVDAANLYEYGFNQFSSVSATDVLPTKTVSIQGGGDPLGTAVLQIKPVNFYLENGYTAENLQAEIESPNTYILGQPFDAKMKVWIQTPEGESIPLGTFDMELHGLDTVLSANVGLIPDNLVGSGKTHVGDPQMILVYTAILLGGGFSVVGAWKLGKQYTERLRWGDSVGFLRKNRRRWPYASVQSPDVFRWRVVRRARYEKPKTKSTFVFRANERK